MPLLDEISGANIDDLKKVYRSFGRLIGVLFFQNIAAENQRMFGNLSELFFKLLTSQRLTFDDLEILDKPIYDFLKTLPMCNSVSYLTFSVGVQNIDGKNKEINLIHNGKNVFVRHCDISKYIVNYANTKLGKDLPLKSYVLGVFDVIPANYFNSSIQHTLLQIKICGVASWNVEELEQNAIIRYSNRDKEQETIQWFYEIIKSFDDEEKALLLKFVTGSATVPPGGFENLEWPFTIEFLEYADYLPQAHTCFNQLVLSQSYRSKDYFKEKLVQAIHFAINIELR